MGHFAHGVTLLELCNADLPGVKKYYGRDYQTDRDGKNCQAFTPPIDRFQPVSKRNLLRNQALFAISQVDELIVSVESQDFAIEGEG